MNPTEPNEVTPREVDALAVCRRLVTLTTPEARSLVWFLQSLSFEPVGLVRVAREVVKMFPDRLPAKPT